MIACKSLTSSQTSGILDFGSKSEIFRSVENLYSPDSSLGTASTCLVLAVGAQCRGSSALDLQRSTSFFSEAQALAFQGMLRDPSVEMVRSFILMAFYMLGACHRNAAFMYLGVAAKAASALGLHRSDHYLDLPFEEGQMR